MKQGAKINKAKDLIENKLPKANIIPIKPDVDL